MLATFNDQTMRTYDFEAKIEVEGSKCDYSVTGNLFLSQNLKTE